MTRPLLLLLALPVATVTAQTAPDTSWVTRSAIYEVYVRDFSPTGNFQGVIRGLDRIQSVGANVIWLMPVYPVGDLNHKGALGSPYAVRDYEGLNPAFGTAADFRALVSAVHARGMKVILDWVPNHTAWDNPWITEHPAYYVHNAKGEISVPVDPQGHLTDWTDVAQLDYKNPDTRSAMIAAMRYWVDTYGIDGFRMDAAGFVSDQFWQECIPALRAAAKRPLMLLAEWGDLKMHRFGFDLTYAWDSYGGLKDVWRGKPASAWVSAQVADQTAMPRGGARMRFTTNHDETAWDKPPVILFGGSAGARAAYVAEALLPGRPLIYDGQEVESPQTLGIFVQDSIVWNQPDTTGTRSFYRLILHLDRTDPAFLKAPMAAVTTTAPDDVIAYTRGPALIAVNARNHPVRAVVTGYRVGGAKDLLTGTVERGDTLALPAYGAVVLER
ncbi:MAG TPA: alpha-amylase family glycosyl hydrolase [Gemmatimonadales bacterium]|nr:alpha-amylase family glycosyl hydrolase [Gemmatimonadales bacterium]